MNLRRDLIKMMKLLITLKRRKTKIIVLLGRTII
jgi:hypothetical protein